MAKFAEGHIERATSSSGWSNRNTHRRAHERLQQHEPHFLCTFHNERLGNFRRELTNGLVLREKHTAV